ncbi:DUF4309 domain-containing protein [Tissierella sp.]|uniref:DUF4309 domain-containing protein n=1 Tax=Tissierella sp. TaxID=41274 RepID=UPI0028545007|nr:DUF4309 domain-containing protein [Tissierella sp.]MDR7856779.1 DUF4309 domain-containing protein [Tissierella sp.]
MKKQIICILLICVTLLTGCLKKTTFDDYFHKTMKEMHKEEKDYAYSLIHNEFKVAHEEDAIAIFTENKDQEETLYIAYYEKQNGNWEWRQTRGTRWQSPIKWESMNKPPYIYFGAIDDNSISEMYAGDTLATMINIEGDKRCWYALSNVKDVEVRAIKKDGTKEIVEQYVVKEDIIPVTHEKNLLLELAYEGIMDGIDIAVGDSTDMIIEKWGIADESEYFMGGLYFKYDDKKTIFFTGAEIDKGEIIHDKVKCIGVFEENKEVFNVRLGMDFKQIISVLGIPTHENTPKQNEVSELLEGAWTIIYDTGEYEIVFASNQENGPVDVAYLWGKK